VSRARGVIWHVDEQLSVDCVLGQVGRERS
jgi:hypothetical protein